MKRITSITVLFIVLSSYPPSVVDAHILETDGNIGAVLHIDPGDDPWVGETANFFFEFKDKSNKFSLAKCICKFVVVQNNEELFRQSLTPVSQTDHLANAPVSYTFLQKNIYEIKIIGTPNETGIFQPFMLSYPLRVSNEKNAHTKISAFAWLFGILISIIFIIMVMRKRNK